MHDDDSGWAYADGPDFTSALEQIEEAQSWLNQ